MSFTDMAALTVSLNIEGKTLKVGRLAQNQSRIYFEYEQSFLAQKIELSPFELPLRSGATTVRRDIFEGLPGVFNDSLPDGWGRLLLDRKLRSEGILPQQFGPLTRLAYVGHHGMGALIYEPDQSFPVEVTPLDLDHIALAAEETLNGDAADVLTELLTLNGSSAGARPKALIGVNTDFSQIIHGQQTLPEDSVPWLVKFPNMSDGGDAGAIEYVYSLMARDAGIEMAACHLFPARSGAGYFATQRFDRVGDQRLHVHSLSGLLHDDFRHPSLDYKQVLVATQQLTKDIREVERMFRLSVFNVLSHNRDDHSKNFSFLMDSQGTWKVSPAYDLTFSAGPQGHQSMLVMGEGKNPGRKHLSALGQSAGLKPNWVKEVIDQTSVTLRQWPALAETYGVSKDSRQLISSRIDNLLAS